mgnify:CR=1 FL=1
MSNKSEWNEIADYSWSQLTAEGYSAWEHLYYTLVAISNNIVFSFSVFLGVIISFVSENSLTLTIVPQISKLAKIITTGNSTFNFTPIANKISSLQIQLDAVFNMFPAISRTLKVFSEGMVNSNLISTIHRTISASILRARFTWNEIAGYSWQKLINAGYVRWRDLYAGHSIFTAILDITVKIEHVVRGIVNFTSNITSHVHKHLQLTKEILFHSQLSLQSILWQEGVKKITTWIEKSKNILSWTEKSKEDSSWIEKERNVTNWLETTKKDNNWEEK